jgi:hypothetical protein
MVRGMPLCRTLVGMRGGVDGAHDEQEQENIIKSQKLASTGRELEFETSSRGRCESAREHHLFGTRGP